MAATVRQRQMANEAEHSVVLSTLMYLIRGEADVDGKSVVEVILDLDTAVNNGSKSLNKHDQLSLSRLKSTFAKSPLYWNEVKISNSSWNMGGFEEGTCAAVFSDHQGNVTVAFRGTGDREWPDNAYAFGGKAGTPSLQQRRAIQYFDRVAQEYNGTGFLEDHHLVVTGHSKGGNKAQAITMMSKYGHLIDRCVSIDGQGFSRQAYNQMRRQIGATKFHEQASKITGVNGDNDYIHGLGNSQLVPPSNRAYVKTNGKGCVAGHHPAYLLAPGGGLAEVTGEAGLGAKVGFELSSRISKLPDWYQNVIAGFAMEQMRKYRCTINAGKDVSRYLGTKLEVWERLLLSQEERAKERASALTGAALVYGIGLAMQLIYFPQDPSSAQLLVLYNKVSKGLSVQLKPEHVNFVTALRDFLNSLATRIGLSSSPINQYAESHSSLLVDTDKMRDYARRLRAVNKRAVLLDQELSKLYRHCLDLDPPLEALSLLARLVKADILTGYSIRLTQCASYLTDTATGFEAAEREITSKSSTFRLE